MAEVIRLLDFRMYKTETAVYYSLQLSNGRECWMVQRRYSEFLRCHVKLLELFTREQLPNLPPKEPFWQKVFGAQALRDDWVEERYARLFGYIVGLLDMEAVQRTDALLEFLNAPDARRHDEPAADEPGAAGAVAVIRSVRVRLTEEPGGVEVVIRADAPARCAVRLALRPLDELQEWAEANPSLEPHDTNTWERLLELDLDPSSSELSHRFELQPGSLWQVAAVGVSKDGSMGNVVCIQIRAPEQETLMQVRHSLAEDAQVRKALEESKAGTPEVADAKETGASSASSATRSSEGGLAGEATGHRCEEDTVLSEEDEEGDAEEVTAPDGTVTRRRRRPPAEANSKVISYQGSVAVEYARRIEEKQRLEAEKTPHRWSAAKRSVPVDRLETKCATGSAAERHHYGTVEVLDNSIQAHQEQQLREDELRLAAWIFSVTGDPQSGAAAAGQASLQEALQTGEVLCDLVNAIWPGRIVGVSRGPPAQILFRRVANITQFVQFCSSRPGLAHSLFAPADLAENRNFRSVVRCVSALAHHVPDSWEGPRLGQHGDFVRSLSPKKP
ncbi:unnamed protein product [Durusdinium trenchii]|uniref:PX domain-containing protein n=1 Tax=Durusdinium trenchii TaxID=1381693 RepID=A0ABP0KEK9_9DINO